VSAPRFVRFAMALSAIVPAPLSAQARPISVTEIDGYLRFLSSDLLEGRAPATRGDKLTVDCKDALEPNRTILGTAQRDWLFDGLRKSQSQWNVLAQQVLMTLCFSGAVALSLTIWMASMRSGVRALERMSE